MASTELQRIFHILDPQPDSLLEPHQFIREADCTLAVKSKQEKKHLFLFHDILLLTTPKKGGKYKLNIIMDFKNKNLTVEGTERGMVIKAKSSGKEFAFTIEDPEGWTAAVQAGIDLSVPGPNIDAPRLDAPYDPYNLQSDEQKAVFDQLRERLNTRDPPLTDIEKAWCDDACLCRYLRARNYDIEKSFKMIDNSLKWRSEFKPHEITAKDIMSEAMSGKIYVNHARDYAGRPIVVMRPGKDTDAAPETKVRFVVYILENAASIMNTNETGVEKMTWLVDFSNSQIGTPNSDSVKVSMDTLNIVQDHYPERLGNAFMLNPPFVFMAFWKILYPFIDPVTKQKIQFMKKKEEYKKLKLYIPAQHLEKDYGGDMEWTFDGEDWKRRMGLGEGATSSEAGEDSSSTAGGDA